MNFKLIPISFFTIALLAGSVNLEAKSLSNSTDNIDSYWTTERLQNAIPMELPRVKHGSLKEVSYIAKSTESVGAEAHLPQIDLKPDNRQLFKPKTNTTTKNQSLDNGNSSQYFTSSRLIPTTASSLYPYRTIGKLFFTTPDGDRSCVASVIAYRIILTAGHCLHSGTNGVNGWYTNFKFIPAYSNGSAPFLTWSVNTSSRRVSREWYVGGGTIPSTGDYGALEIVDQTINGTVQTIGSVTGTLGWRTGMTYPNHAHLVGYSNNMDNGEMQHWVAAQAAKVVDANNVEIGSDMNVGTGGTPWIQNLGFNATGQSGGNNSTRNTVIGTTSYAYDDTYTLVNGGSAFDASFADMMNTICSARVGNC